MRLAACVCRRSRACRIFAMFTIALGMAGAQERDAAVACGDVLDTPGALYLLKGDLNCTTSPAIWIRANRVRFNLAGFTIRGSGGTGILITSPDFVALTGVRLLNGTVTGFAVGIEITNANNSQVIGMTIAGNRAEPGHGIQVLGGSGNTYIDNTVVDNTTGFYLSASFGGTFIDNVVSGNTNGYYFSQAGNNTVLSGSISDNTGFGVLIGAVSGNTIRGCTIARNGTGVLATGPGTHGNTIQSNTVTGNLSVGIDMNQRADTNLIKNNTATGNGIFDLFDFVPGCSNTWTDNMFGTANQTCIH